MRVVSDHVNSVKTVLNRVETWSTEINELPLPHQPTLYDNIIEALTV